MESRVGVVEEGDDVGAGHVDGDFVGEVQEGEGDVVGGVGGVDDGDL